MLRKPPTLHYGSIGGKRKRNTAVLQRSMSRAGGLSRNSDSMADRRGTGEATLPLRCLAAATPLWTCGKRTPCYASYSLPASLKKTSGSTAEHRKERLKQSHLSIPATWYAPPLSGAVHSGRSRTPLQLNTAAPQNLRSAGTAAFTRGRFFYAAAYADRLLSACRTAADAAERIYLWHFSIAQ